MCTSDARGRYVICKEESGTNPDEVKQPARSALVARNYPLSTQPGRAAASTTHAPSGTAKGLADHPPAVQRPNVYRPTQPDHLSDNPAQQHLAASGRDHPVRARTVWEST